MCEDANVEVVGWRPDHCCVWLAQTSQPALTTSTSTTFICCIRAESTSICRLDATDLKLTIANSKRTLRQHGRSHERAPV